MSETKETFKQRLQTQKPKANKPNKAATGYVTAVTKPTVTK